MCVCTLGIVFAVFVSTLVTRSDANQVFMGSDTTAKNDTPKYYPPSDSRNITDWSGPMWTHTDANSLTCSVRHLRGHTMVLFAPMTIAYLDTNNTEHVICEGNTSYSWWAVCKVDSLNETMTMTGISNWGSQKNASFLCKKSFLVTRHPLMYPLCEEGRYWRNCERHCSLLCNRRKCFNLDVNVFEPETVIVDVVGFAIWMTYFFIVTGVSFGIGFYMLGFLGR